MYTKRGAPCELAVLAGAPRHRVAARLVKPGGLSDSTIYNECQALAFDALAIKVSGIHASKGCCACFYISVTSTTGGFGFRVQLYEWFMI